MAVNKKFCMVIASMEAGGQERVMSELCNSLSEMGYQINLILLHQSNIFYKLNDNIKVIQPNFSINGFINRILYSFRILFYLRKNILNISPVSVLSFGRIHSPYVVMSLLRSGIPVFVADRGSPLYKGKLFNEVIRKYMYKFADGIIAQTNYSKDFISHSIGHKNIMVIPNPIRRIKRIEIERENIIIFVGRLIYKKGVHLLIQSFHDTYLPDWKLVIVGNGPMRSSLENQVNNLGIVNRVEFLGLRREIDELLSKAEIFAFPSFTEGFPNALLEAMGNGLACVSFDCVTGPSDIIKDGENGFLVELYNTEEFTRRLKFLMLNPELRKTFQDTALAVNVVYNIEKIAKLFIDFISNSNGKK